MANLFRETNMDEHFSAKNQNLLFFSSIHLAWCKNYRKSDELIYGKKERSEVTRIVVYLKHNSLIP